MTQTPITLPDRDKAITREDIEREIRLLENNASDCHVRTETVAMLRDIWARIEALESALKDVREEICVGPVNDVLWHRNFPSETTVDFICNTLGDDWDYNEWLESREALKGETTND